MCFPYWRRAAGTKNTLRLLQIQMEVLVMKKIAIELLIATATVIAYVLPVLAEGGGY